MSTLTNPEAIYEGLQIPKKHNPLKLKVKEVIVEKKISDEDIKKKEGQYFEDKDVDKIFDEVERRKRRLLNGRIRKRSKKAKRLSIRNKRKRGKSTMGNDVNRRHVRQY